MSANPALAATVAAVVISFGAASSLGATRASTATTPTKCVSRAGMPDRDCTPGALNPNVKQRNIKKTICVPNWTDTVRPPTSYTNKLKVQGIADYGFKDKTLGQYEEDHLIPLAVGGSPRSPRTSGPNATRASSVPA